MLKKRIIPILLWDGKQCVQTTKFQRPYRPVGSMMQHIEVMESRNIDELIILDIVATAEGRKPLFNEIKEFTSKLFCPVTIGGGISELDDIKRLIQDCGADKVAMKTNYDKLAMGAIEKFGAQAIVQVIDTGKYLVNYYDHNAGELLITQIDRNGTQEGYNLDILKHIHKYWGTPVIINGGCGKPEHMKQAFDAGASACGASSMFLFTEHTPKSVARKLAEWHVEVRLDA